jgi:phosphopantothenate synthetase
MKGVPRTASNMMARIFRNALIEALRHGIVQISGLIAGVENYFLGYGYCSFLSPWVPA